MERLDLLKDYLTKIKRVNAVVTLFFWDMDTVMPEQGIDLISETLNHYEEELFNLKTSDELKKILDDLSVKEEFEKLDSKWQFIVSKMKRDLDKDARIPKELYSEFVEVATRGRFDWKKAKQTGDFSVFVPYLEKLIEVKKKMYSYTHPGMEIYDAMLSDYEEGLTSEKLDKLFGDLKAELVPILKDVIANTDVDLQKYEGYYDPDAQKKVQKLLLEYMGFDFSKGAVGETEHPFTLNFNSKDVRITNHYYDDDPFSSIFSAIHEGGHAIFEQNVNPEYDDTVAGSCDNMGMHESQSRFYENILGRNINFWLPIYSDVQELLPKLKEISIEDFVARTNYVKNSLIRIEADEFTYCFHIILRYEMEQAIFRDNVPVSELPALWNKKMEEYLGVVPENDGVGILQDSHWSGGDFGYFPTYLLGSIYDGMILDKINEDLGNVDELLKEGRIKEITKWLNENIHVYGSTKVPCDWLEELCGKEISAEPLIRYFKNKYM